MPAELRLGVDIGRVIIDGSAHHQGDTAFFDGDLASAMQTSAVQDVFEVLPRIVQRFEHKVWLVSKCGERIQMRSLAWLEHHDFYARTGIDPSAVRFCRTRLEKAVHAADLALTDFVDDRLDVLASLRDLVERCYLFGPQRLPGPSWATTTPTWPAVEEAIEQSLVVRSRTQWAW